MTAPTFDTFQKTARGALMYVDASKDILDIFDKKGPSFDFWEDGGIDSLDRLDIVFYIEKHLGIKLQGEELLHDGTPVTLGNLYKSIKQDSKTSA